MDYLISQDAAYNRSSQFGEDGLVSACFELIGTTNEWCLEVGAADGEWLSNTLLLREQGWQAILIESRKPEYEALVRRFGDSAFCVHQTCTDLDSVLTDFCPHESIDFVSIDIDGQDYWLWHDLQRYRPRVVCIEHSPYLNQWQCFKDAPVPRGQEGQTAKWPIMRLATEKSYKLAAETYCNLIFIAEEALP